MEPDSTEGARSSRMRPTPRSGGFLVISIHISLAEPGRLAGLVKTEMSDNWGRRSAAMWFCKRAVFELIELST